MKRKIILISISALLCLLMLSFVFLDINTSKQVSSASYENLTVVIDAGHGGEDGGAVANNIVEKDINLQIALKLDKVLRASGFKTKLIRKADEMVNTDGTVLRERKVSDMKNRLAIYNESESNVVISIHQNKFEQEKYYGSQVFYSTNNPKSLRLAESIRGSIISLLQPDNLRECKPAGNNIYLLYNAKTPSVIVECGFLSNYEEAQKLCSDDYQNMLAFAVFAGFLQYYSEG